MATDSTKKTSIASNGLLWLVAVGFFMETLDATIVNTALPSMAKSLGESPLSMHSVVIAYSLTLAVLIPASGWIADRFGIRKAFFSAILIFSIGSLLCALSQTLLEIVAARVLQGIGGCMLMPIGRLAVLRSFPGADFLPAISFVTIPGLVGPLIGPTLGGWLVEVASWHWIFLINIPIGIIGLIATYYMMRGFKPEHPKEKFDLSGFLRLSFFMVSISLALDGASELGFAHGTMLVLIVFGLASLISYVFHAYRNKDAIFSLELFNMRTYSIGLAGNFFARLGSSGMPFLIPLLLQVNLGFSPFQAGLMMIPIAASGIFAKRFGTYWITRWGYRNFLMGNTFAVGVMIASFYFITAEQNFWLRVIQLSIFGFVNSLQFTAMNTVTLKDIEKDRTASGNSLFSMVQMLAMSFAVAFAGLLLNSFMTYYGTTAAPGGSLRAFHATFICMGLFTCSSAWIFSQLAPELKNNRKEPQSLEVV
jgi:EmrB/QacA subfamily drug resistance transporter